MLFHAARQPILNRNKELVAYELLFRDGVSNVFPNVDADVATNHLIAGGETNFGLEDFTGTKPAYINFTLETLVKNFPTLVPKEQIVVEILETVKPGKRLLAECQKLKEKGYTLALDDYVHQPVWRHFYPYIDIIKVDFLATQLPQIEKIIGDLRDFPQITLLAEKVETNEHYQQALELGFEYFQGYFFARPEAVRTRSLSPAQYTLAELLYETTKADLDLPKIISTFELDVNLSYKLLRYSNSALFKRRVEISTIKQAIITLGKAELKRFISILFTSQVNEDQPAELMCLSLTRAKFSEGLSEQHHPGQESSSAFLMGMMSLMDAILGEPMAAVMEKLPLSQEINDALLLEQGDMATYLAIVKHYEQAEWSQAEALVSELGIDAESMAIVYHDAVKWANEQMGLMTSMN